ncbi:FAD-dependent oxidoreductase [Belnapia sp. F-4-1]|uniref:flavin monoamine oxidase family protein n=1 Tax=Belnapia sp. F-4-1 TaxID=1545443 RepID=UPI0005BBA4B9|nr:FAD-dependent oxidoreductase [Belnapia sp. F-4-1]
MISRRALLEGAAAAGGARAAVAVIAVLGGLPAAPAAAAPPALPRDGRRVVVVGAGIAGLVAALEMQRAGWWVRVLEAAPRPGGRCMTLRAGDVVEEEGGPAQRVAWDAAPHLYANPGPARIPHHHRGILGYCRTLGVPLEVLVDENRAALLEASTGPVPMRRVQADLRGLIAELAAKGLERGTAEAPLGEGDLDALRAMLRRFGALGRDMRYHGTSRAGWVEPPSAGLGPPRAMAPLDPRLLLEPALWEGAAFAEGVDYAATMLQPVGGMDRIAAALAATVGDALVTGAEVLSLRRTESGARVAWRGIDGAVREEEALRILLALPAPVLAQLDSDLSAERKAGFAALHQAAAAKLAFQCGRRFWEEDHAIYGGISWLPREATQLWYPSHGFHAARGILIGAYIWDDKIGERFGARSPAERAAVVAADGEVLHPGLSREVSKPVSIAWRRMPRARGAWTEWTAEQRRSLYPLLRSPEGPYHFAGDYLSWFTGWQEGAVLSAWAALEQMA